MIDIRLEHLVPVASVPDHLKKVIGHEHNKSTIYRWCLKGRNSRRLEWIKIGGTRYTSVEALERFFEQSPPAGPNSGGASASSPDPRDADNEARRLLNLDPVDDDDDDHDSGDQRRAA